jgi:hypothetical protein
VTCILILRACSSIDSDTIDCCVRFSLFIFFVCLLIIQYIAQCEPAPSLSRLLENHPGIDLRSLYYYYYSDAHSSRFELLHVLPHMHIRIHIYLFIFIHHVVCLADPFSLANDNMNCLSLFFFCRFVDVILLI